MIPHYKKKPEIRKKVAAICKSYLINFLENRPQRKRAQSPRESGPEKEFRARPEEDKFERSTQAKEKILLRPNFAEFRITPDFQKTNFHQPRKGFSSNPHSYTSQGAKLYDTNIGTERHRIPQSVVLENMNSQKQRKKNVEQDRKLNKKAETMIKQNKKKTDREIDGEKERKKETERQGSYGEKHAGKKKLKTKLELIIENEQ
ncbi:hypothetical protein RUM43_008262 [Polyplax serrata]|uniref:Uncharacterized protein n=1 Tax=Polyplax serrata TaxID=468196 RepID=A0AAN8P6T4_POLSC